jgi:Ca2+-binding RTX toxin-like protein
MKSLKTSKDSTMLETTLEPVLPTTPIPPATPLPNPKIDMAPGIMPVDVSSGVGTGSQATKKGTEGNDTMFGTGLAETMFGLSGDDVLFGGEGNDRLEGGIGNDRLYGEAGDDLLHGGAGADWIDGGDGVDTVTYAVSAGGVTVNLAGGAINPDNDATIGSGLGGDAHGDVYIGVENVIGSAFNDRIIGNAVSNRLEGGAGDDTIVGGGGADRIVGGNGRDTLTGDGDGSVSADVFVFRQQFPGGWNSDASRDVITDFQQGIDKLDLGIDAGAFGEDGELAWGWWDSDGLHVNSLGQGDRLLFDIGSGTLYRCFVAGDHLHLRGQVVIINPEVERLSASDFILA